MYSPAICSYWLNLLMEVFWGENGVSRHLSSNDPGDFLVSHATVQVVFPGPMLVSASSQARTAQLRPSWVPQGGLL